MKAVMVYMTAGSVEEAEELGKLLVTGGLAACVNIIENMRSIYTWQGKLQKDREAVLIAKTLESKVQDLVETVSRAHSYECPCVVTLPVTGGNPDFLEWIAAEVQASPDG